MIVRKCTACGAITQEPLTWAVISWQRTDNVRRSYKNRLCVECVATKLAPVQVASERPLMLCPSCGIDTTDNYDAVYGTFIPRGVGKFRFEAPFCPPCAVPYRAWAQQGGELLEDRPLEDRSDHASEPASANSIWATLGLTPRERG